MKTIIAALSVLCMLAGTPALAGQSYIYGGIGLLSPTLKDKPEHLTENLTPNLTLGFGHNFNEYIALETFFNYSKTDYTNEWNQLDDTQYEMSLGQLGFSIVPSTGEIGRSGIKLYTRLNASMVNVRTETTFQGYPHKVNDSGFMLDAGVGIQWNINKRFMFRGEYITNVADSSLDNFDFENSIRYEGIQLALGYRF
ncbi:MULTISPECIES: porin family protein [unclassified Photobacterium]|uniref:porin family protein n=1 Tax=unclassified Photobacterium TaxID=2628852 RepID=UPI001B8AE355|nr:MULTISPECIES: porin family protein [unclassified Photobacterium]MDO6707185.1 porin family protein [Photobacterium sp. 1_MG-2023]QUJ68188.1 porin family protein [Photobacterium sp. GJ3]